MEKEKIKKIAEFYKLIHFEENCTLTVNNNISKKEFDNFFSHKKEKRDKVYNKYRDKIYKLSDKKTDDLSQEESELHKIWIELRDAITKYDLYYGVERKFNCACKEAAEEFLIAIKAFDEIYPDEKV